jgi:hypothetical protein
MAAFCKLNVVFEKNVRESKLQLVIGKESPRTYVSATAEYMVVSAGLDELARLIASLTLLKKPTSVELTGIGICCRVPQTSRINHDMRATRNDTTVGECCVFESCTFQNHWGISSALLRIKSGVWSTNLRYYSTSATLS